MMNKDHYERPSGRVRRASGFTLIEITLALMVVSVGILAIVNLYVVGMDQGQRAMMDERLAAFGQTVLAGVRHEAETDWNNFESQPIQPATGDLWSAGFSIKKGAAPPDLSPNEIFAPDSYGAGAGIDGYLASAAFTNLAIPDMVDHAFRYTIIPKTVTVTNLFDPGITVINKGVMLYMFPGQFGAISTGALPFMCYTEMFNFEKPAP